VIIGKGCFKSRFRGKTCFVFLKRDIAERKEEDGNENGK